MDLAVQELISIGAPLLSVALTGFAIYKIVKLYDKDRNKDLGHSFRDALDLSGLPVIVCRYNDDKINLLVDSGSNRSLIDENFVKMLELKEAEDFIANVNTVEKQSKKIELNIGFKDTERKILFYSVDMSNLFDSIKKETGVTIHGIIGTDFLDKNKSIIDFEECIIYNKKR